MENVKLLKILGDRNENSRISGNSVANKNSNASMGNNGKGSEACSEESEQKMQKNYERLSLMKIKEQYAENIRILR